MLITLTTDFGLGGRYVAQMKGVLYHNAPGVTVVDLSHTIPPQDIAAAARLLEESTPCWPKGTVHLAVVDPGVGTDRPIVAVLARGHWFVGPDNGLFGWLGERFDEATRIDMQRFEETSETFHGRDIMAPVAAALALGESASRFGAAHLDLAELPASEGPTLGNDQIECRIVEIDHYGNLITNLKVDDLDEAPRDERLRITLGEHETFGLWRTYADQPPQTLLALVGSTGHVELAITNGSAVEMLGARMGDPVTVDWDHASS